ncbi:hypothetical protein NPIL_11311 [Nephila pilipes]|uniref:Uncharacterized protein n=1 Tax=Nephila pilipes TaxID=299642 RepID=A0A8X6QRQ4_NEPPI|nr:hypothetical protein NPIL_11311 [Nephila pilipes]
MNGARRDPPEKMGEWVGWLERSIARDQSLKPILPFFFGFFLLPTLGQRPFTDGKQRHPGGMFHMLGNTLQSPLKSFPPLSEAWAHQTPLPRLSPYKSRLLLEPSHSAPLRSP